MDIRYVRSDVKPLDG